MPISDALVQQGNYTRLEGHTVSPLKYLAPSTSEASSRRLLDPRFRPLLRYEKDFVRVGVLYFGARRKPANIDVALIRCVRTGHKSRLIRNGNTVRQIAFGRPRCRGSRGLRRRVFFRRLGRRRRLVGVVGLRYRLFWRVRITRHAMTHWRLIIRA